MTYLALLFLPVAYLLSYPIEYVISKTLGRASMWALRKRAEWDAAYRD